MSPQDTERGLNRDVDEWALAMILQGLAPFMPPDLLDRALTVARRIRDCDSLLEALCGLGPCLGNRARAETAREALKVAWRLSDDCTDDFYFATVLHQLAPWLPDVAMEETLSVLARPDFDVYDRVEAVVELMPHLPDALKVQALEMIGATSAASLPYVGISDIAPHLPPDLAYRVYGAILERGDPSYHALTLVRMAPRLPIENRPRGLDVALSAVLEVEPVSVRAAWLVELAPHLPQPLQTTVLDELLATIRQVSDTGSRIRALTEIVPHLPKGEARQALHEALLAIRDLEPVDLRLLATTEIVPLLPDAERDEALAEFFAFLKHHIGLPNCNLYVGKIAPHLSSSMQADAVAMLGESGQVQRVAHDLSEIAPDLGEEAQCEALSVVGGIGDIARRAAALHSFAVHFTGAPKSAAIRGLAGLLADLAGTAPPAGNDPAEIDKTIGLALNALSGNDQLR